MPVLTVRMDDELLRKLETLARRRGVTRSALVKKLLQEALKRQERGEVWEEVLQALRKGRRPSVSVDWSHVKEELSRTEPRFLTVEEALAASRRWPRESHDSKA